MRSWASVMKLSTGTCKKITRAGSFSSSNVHATRGNLDLRKLNHTSGDCEGSSYLCSYYERFHGAKNVCQSPVSFFGSLPCNIEGLQLFIWNLHGTSQGVRPNCT